MQQPEFEQQPEREQQQPRFEAADADPLRPAALACLVTAGRPEVSVSCAISLIKLGHAEGAPQLNVHFVPTLNDAFNALWLDREGAEGVVVSGTSVGFEADFVTRAVASGRDVVSGVYPLPVIDWERVKTRPVGEAPEHWGAVYNLTPKSEATEPTPDGYVESDVHELGLAWVTRRVVDDIVARHPEIVASTTGRAAFACPGVFDGREMSETARFLDLYGGVVHADLAAPAVNTGVAEFGGCVGHRSLLR